MNPCLPQRQALSISLQWSRCIWKIECLIHLASVTKEIGSIPCSRGLNAQSRHIRDAFKRFRHRLRSQLDLIRAADAAGGRDGIRVSYRGIGVLRWFYSSLYWDAAVVVWERGRGAAGSEVVGGRGAGSFHDFRLSLPPHSLLDMRQTVRN